MIDGLKEFYSQNFGELSHFEIMEFKQKAVYCAMKIGAIALGIVGGVITFQGLKLCSSIISPWIFSKAPPVGSMADIVVQFAMVFFGTLYEISKTGSIFVLPYTLIAAGGLMATVAGCAAVPVLGVGLSYMSIRMWNKAEDIAFEY